MGVVSTLDEGGREGKDRRCFLLLGWLCACVGMAGAWRGIYSGRRARRAGAGEAARGEGHGHAWSSRTGRREGHGVTSGLSLHGAQRRAPVSRLGWTTARQGGPRPDGHVGAGAAAVMRPRKRGRWALAVSTQLAVVSRPMQISLRLGRGFWQFGACTAVAHLVIDLSSNDPVRYESLSSYRAETQAPGFGESPEPGELLNRTRHLF